MSHLYEWLTAKPYVTPGLHPDGLSLWGLDILMVLVAAGLVFLGGRLRAALWREVAAGLVGSEAVRPRILR